MSRKTSQFILYKNTYAIMYSKIIKINNSYILYFSYNPDLIADLKANIPSHHLRWNPRHKFWQVSIHIKDSRFLTDVKLGKYHYANDCIGERLSELIDRVESYAKNSKYPEAIDINFWEIWVTSLYKS